ncbi:MAG: hypothetical protein GY753_02605, partial [Gammaproteobacteria bacterium]|nr:hypothetical protein [Gammaproteobacteria bacterium]
AASAPYAAGADLNCDLSSDLLLVPTGEYPLLAAAADGNLRTQSLVFNDQGRWLGPAPQPRALADLPSAGANSSNSALSAQSVDNATAQTTTGLAFRIYDNNITSWITDTLMVGNWDKDTKTADIAGWTGTDWTTWHADGFSSNQLTFSEYPNNIPDTVLHTVTDTAARIQGDFDGDGLDDLAVWDSSAWQFVRAGGVTDSAFRFTDISSNFPALAAGGDTSKMFLGDFDGNDKTDIAAWNGDVWKTYTSIGTSSFFTFAKVENNLGSLVNGDATLLIPGDFDGDGKSDVASLDSDTSNWMVWISQDVSNDALTFTLSPDDSLGYGIDSTVSRVAADFSA